MNLLVVVPMNNSDSVSPLHIVLLSMTASGLQNHVFAISPLVSASGRDAWIAVFFTTVPVLLWVPLLIYIHKKSGSLSLLNLLKDTVGTKVTNIVIFIIVCYFVLMAGVSLRETITWTNVAYLPETPPILLAIVFIFVCWILASSSFRTMNTVNVFILFFIILLGFFVAIANIPNKDFYLLLPVLEHGYRPVFKGMIYQAAGMAELFFFLLLQHKINAPFRFRHFLASTIILTMLTAGPLVGAIIEFGPTEATRQRYPPYEEWGLVSIGRFVEHVDFLSIYQWLSGVFIRISVLLLIIKEVLPTENDRKKNGILFFLSIVVVGIVMFPITDFHFNHLLRTYILPASFWFLFCFSIIFSFVVMIHSRGKGGKSSGF